VRNYRNTSTFELTGLKRALTALEAQRKRDLEQWLDDNDFDFVVFPSAGDVGKADLEFNLNSAQYALQNGVKYSDGNRSIRHLGVPTVSVPMGIMANKRMPVNLTFLGKAYTDNKLLQYAYLYEQRS
jgi:Asp-tRNA(Asn)/Glu-tRNA(Gln) amidotransferase A subunit family amidase